MKKCKVYLCYGCDVLTKDPHKLRMREFYYSKENRPFIGAIVKRKTMRTVVLCENCFNKLFALE